MKNTCADILIPAPITLDPECTLNEALQTIVSARMRYIPVVDSQNDFVGLFSSFTLLSLLLPQSVSMNFGKKMPDLGFMTTNLEEFEERLKERGEEKISQHIFAREIKVCTPKSSIMEAVHILNDTRSHVIILEENSRQFIGIITIVSILAAITEQSKGKV